jgi:hypothetical protein
MILTFAEDFGSSVILDSELRGTSDSGLYWNRGVNSLVTVNNLLSLLPDVEFTFAAYAAGTTYSKFNTSRSINDIVLESGKVYQSLKDSNTGNLVTDTNFWLETNIKSLRIKSFIWTTLDNYKAALSLNRSLIENQYLYNVADQLKTLTEDYSGWSIEPKGSDYIKIVLNQLSLQADVATPVNLFVINQGQLIDTIVLNPNNGLLEFEDIGFTFYGKGPFHFVFESQDVLSNSENVDTLKYSGFVAYPITGKGASPQAAEYSQASSGNGLNFNISVYLDSGIYVDNNEVHLAKFIQSQFEMDSLELFYYNPNQRSNRTERVVNDREALFTEIKDVTANTAARRYLGQKKIAMKSIERTFDKFLKPAQKFVVKQRSI